MLTNGDATVNHTDHPLSPRHNKSSSPSRRLSTNHSQVSDFNGNTAGSSTTRDLLSPSYRASIGDSPYHHDDQFSNADSGIRSGSYYEKTSMADSAIVGVSDYDDRESTPESGIRLVPPQPLKSSVSSQHPPLASQSNSSLRVQNSISPSAVHPVTSGARSHRLSVPSYLSHHNLAWEAPHKSTVIVVTHTGKEVGKHSAKSTRSHCNQLTPGSSVRLISTQDDVNEDTNIGNCNNHSGSSDNGSSSKGGDDESDEDMSRCVAIAWPTNWRRRIVYPFLFPLIVLLYFTLPNVNKPVSNYMVDLVEY